MKIVLAICFISLPLWSVTFDSLGEDLENKIHEKKEQYLHEDQKSRNFKSQIYKVAKQIEKLKDQEEEIQRDMLSAKTKVSSHLSALKDKEQILAVQKKIISHKLRRFASWHKNAVGDLFFSSQSANDLDKRLFYIKRLVRGDLDQLEAHQKDIQDYLKLRSSLKGRLQSLAKMKKDLESKQKELEKLKSHQQKLLAEASKVKALVLGALKDLRKNSTSPESANLSASFFEQKGRIELPIRGEILRRFGVHTKEKKRVSLFSSSLHLYSKEKQFVRSIFSGKVVFSEELEGYGKTVILDHGDNYYSVYSNLKFLRSQLGERVAQGEVIADMGGSIDPDKNTIEFQIRHFSEAIDPEKWLKKTELNLAKGQADSSSL